MGCVTLAEYNEMLKHFYYSFCKVREILDCMEDGEVFDYEDLSDYLYETEVYEKLVCKLRSELKLEGGYNIARTMPLQGGRLEDGRLISSNSERIMQFAKKWTEKPPKGNCTLYEVGTFLKMLQQFEEC